MVIKLALNHSIKALPSIKRAFENFSDPTRNYPTLERVIVPPISIQDLRVRLCDY